MNTTQTIKQRAIEKALIRYCDMGVPHVFDMAEDWHDVTDEIGEISRTGFDHQDVFRISYFQTINLCQRFRWAHGNEKLKSVMHEATDTFAAFNEIRTGAFHSN